MKSWKFTKPVLLVLFVVICMTNRCECDDDESNTVSSDLDIVGTWILKSAVFQEDDVDLDEDGPMLPIKDAKYFLFGLFDIYANCSSIDEIPIQFSEEIASPGISGKPARYYVNAVCTEGQGITSPFAEYYLNPESRTSFIIEIDELNDPAGLIDWEQGYLVIFVTEDSVSAGTRTMNGFVSLRTSNYIYHQINWVLEEYSGN